MLPKRYAHKRYRMLPKTDTQEVYYVTQEVYPRGMRCYPRGMGCYPRGMNYMSWSASSYLLQCVFIPLALHMHTSWVAWMSPKRYEFDVTQEVCLLRKRYDSYLLGYTRYTSWVAFHTSWVTFPYLLGDIHALQEVCKNALQEVYPRGMKCTPRGLNPSHDFLGHTSWSAFHTSYRCRLQCMPPGLHLIPLGSHFHVSWITPSIPLGVHAIPLG